MCWGIALLPLFNGACNPCWMEGGLLGRAKWGDTLSNLLYDERQQYNNFLSELYLWTILSGKVFSVYISLPTIIIASVSEDIKL